MSVDVVPRVRDKGRAQMEVCHMEVRKAASD